MIKIFYYLLVILILTLFWGCATKPMIQIIYDELEGGKNLDYSTIVEKLGNPSDYREDKDNILAMWEHQQFERKSLASTLRVYKLLIEFDKKSLIAKKWELKKR